MSKKKARKNSRITDFLKQYNRSIFFVTPNQIYQMDFSPVKPKTIQKKRSRTDAEKENAIKVTTTATVKEIQSQYVHQKERLIKARRQSETCTSPG